MAFFIKEILWTYFSIGMHAILPLLVYMLVGRFIARRGWMSDQAFGQANTALFKLLLPINIFLTYILRTLAKRCMLALFSISTLHLFCYMEY